jgi:hypothetical protein
MRMVQVDPKGTPFICTCISCGKRLQSNRQDLGLLFADLDGKPFLDYYCQECKEKREQPLKNRLMAAIPSLTDADFAFHATDLYVVASPEVENWLENNYEFWLNVSTFMSQPGSNWNGAGKRCFDIPFAGNWER